MIGTRAHGSGTRRARSRRTRAAIPRADIPRSERSRRQYLPNTRARRRRRARCGGLRARSTSAASATSTVSTWAKPCARAASSDRASRSQRATRAPLAASRCATARPIPAAPPVTTARRPSKSSLFIVRRSSMRMRRIAARAALSVKKAQQAHHDDDQGRETDDGKDRREQVAGLALEHDQLVGELSDLCRRRERLGLGVRTRFVLVERIEVVAVIAARRAPMYRRWRRPPARRTSGWRPGTRRCRRCPSTRTRPVLRAIGHAARPGDSALAGLHEDLVRQPAGAAESSSTRNSRGRAVRRSGIPAARGCHRTAFPGHRSGDR